MSGVKGNKGNKKNKRTTARRIQAIVALIVLAAMVVVMIVSSILVQAAPSSIDSSGLAVGQTSVFYDASIGMPTSEANAIAQTSDGFIWIGSYSGLIRYDGNTFYRFDSSQGISSVISLCVDSHDRLWVGTNDNGVVLIDGQEYTFYGKDDGLKALSIKDITEDRNGNIVVATTSGMAYIDPDLNMHTLDDEKVNNEYVCELRSGNDGTLYGETLDGDFFYMDDLKVGGYYNGEELGLGPINCICPDPKNDGWVYLGTEKSDVIHTNIKEGMTQKEIKTYPSQSFINMIYFADGLMWICSDDGIGHVDSFNRYYKLQNMSVNNSVDTMMQDMEGNLWFASSRQGIMKIAYSVFSDINRLANLEPRVCNTTIKYQDKLYIGTDTGLIILEDDEWEVKNELVELLDGIRIRSMKVDSKGNLWICTYSELGLLCVHPDGTYTNYNEDDGFTSTRVRTVTELSDGRIVVSTSGGVFFVSGDKVVPVTNSESFSNTEILTICEGDDGKILFGSDGDGLYMLDGDRVTRYGLDEGLRSEVILRVKKDTEREGYYWIITSNSISYMHDDKITTIDQFPYSNNFDIFFSKNKDIWVLSSGGIYRVHGDAMLANQEIEYTLYDKESGMPYVTTANSRNYIDDEGDLYIACTTGICKVNIDDSDLGSAEAMLNVPFVEADGEIIEPDESGTVRIPARTRRLTIYGYVLTYTLNNPHVRYSLDGFDKEPMYTTKRDMAPVTYTNLDGGRYTYRLATIDTATDSVVDEYSLTIIKTKALYEMWWFRILTLIVVGLLIAFIVYRYTKKKTAKLEREKAEKQQLVDETIYVFAKCIDMKDNYTRGHSFRVSKYTGLLAEKMGYGPEEVHEMRNIALLHDIGKISIPDAILNKQSGLTDDEYAIMKSHASNGYDVLKYVSIMPNLADGAGYHHERLDGKGYPYGKSGDEIPMVAQIIAVADTFDAMYSTRPYRKKMPLMEVIAEIERVAGTQLNAEVVRCLVELAKEGMLEDETAV